MGLLGIFPHITGIGDSLMSGEHVTDKFDYLDNFDYAWIAYMCRRIGAKCTIKSHGGATAKDWYMTYGRKTFESQEKCPCYFICLGSNDFGQGYKIGSVKDTTETNTYCAWYNEIIKTIRANNPYSYLFLCSMYNSENDKNENGDTRGDFNNAVKEIAKQYERAYYLDFINNGEAILGEEDITLNGHYNTIGYYKVSFAFEKCADKIIKENLEDFKKVGLYHSFGSQYPHIKKNF